MRCSFFPDILGKICEDNRKYGFFKIWLGSYLHTVLCTPEDAQIFCTSTALLDRTDHFKFFKAILGDGLFTASGKQNLLFIVSTKSTAKLFTIFLGSEWRKAKQVMEPVFKYSSIKTFFPIVQKKTDILIECLKKEVGKPEFCFRHYMENCSFDIIVGKSP